MIRDVDWLNGDHGEVFRDKFNALQVGCGPCPIWFSCFTTPIWTTICASRFGKDADANDNHLCLIIGALLRRCHLLQATMRQQIKPYAIVRHHNHYAPHIQNSTRGHALYTQAREANAALKESNLQTRP
nr:hypothetical protein CFP56_53710 [Quercus suber]